MTSESNSTHKHLFATPLVETKMVDHVALNIELVDRILRQQKRDKGMQRSNMLGWHSREDIMEWGGEPVKKLAVHALETCSEYTTDLAMKGDIPRYSWSIQMWANVSPAGASNQYHAHPGSFWSAVYYVDDGGDATGGPLIILDPRFPMNRMLVPDLEIVSGQDTDRSAEYSVLPTPGKMVMFPSWLSHGVRPHLGTRPRISIAMNILPRAVTP